MPRRWIAAVAAIALAVVGIACEGGDIHRPEHSPSPHQRSASIAALGDSITTAFGSCLALTSCPRNSWSTGSGIRVDSIRSRLLDDDPGLGLDTHNEAVAGARATALPDQASAAVRHRADYVTILIGANDACRPDIDQMTSVSDFRADLDHALRILRKGRPKAQVLVASIPDLNRLWSAGHTDRLAVRVWAHGVCPSLLANPTSTAAADAHRRAAFAARIDAYDDQLAAACAGYGKRCRYDGGAVHRVKITMDMVNPLDSFHPDVDGQHLLASTAWHAWRLGS
ncbi:GDSL-type esterase/lipase family protein [Plantactinospora sp. KBS50]|uniref:GDSL-type esterase/lipase family protein n=1 Tax=Plantactinospora sp. KBS50 TaxID=2024580 RepID=UPI000BAAB5DE|nr:GDSL-type esterase/lipase family protein [Plantactinospora sp. KBS50]ASW54552.1 GDSL family lipase [Plantactinospora sp. KBS50]